MMTHRPGNSSLPIRSFHTAKPRSSQVKQEASPIGIGRSSDPSTPILSGTCPYFTSLDWLIWAKYRGVVASSLSAGGSSPGTTLRHFTAPGRLTSFSKVQISASALPASQP